MAQEQKFVGRFERAVMQYIVLSKAKETGEVTKENLQGIFRGNLQNLGKHLDECLQVLTQEGHLRQEGNKYRITDDGREDIQQVQPLVMELQQYAGGGQQQPRGQQATTAGGYGAGTQNPGQPKGGPGQSSVGQNR